MEIRVAGTGGSGQISPLIRYDENVRMERIKSLQLRIASGDYAVTAARVAEKMIVEQIRG